MHNPFTVCFQRYRLPRSESGWRLKCFIATYDWGLAFLVKCSEIEFGRTFVTAMEDPGFSNRVRCRGDQLEHTAKTFYLPKISLLYTETLEFL